MRGPRERQFRPDPSIPCRTVRGVELVVEPKARNDSRTDLPCHVMSHNKMEKLITTPILIYVLCTLLVQSLRDSTHRLWYEQKGDKVQSKNEA